MMSIALTLEELEALKPCEPRLVEIRKLIKWDGAAVTAEEAKAAGVTFEDLIWVASAVARTDEKIERRIRLWMSDCAARVLHVFEADQPYDDRPRRAIEAGRAYARGEIDDYTRYDAWIAAEDAAWSATKTKVDEAARTAARTADAAIADRAAAGAWDAAWAAGAGVWPEERKWQFDRLIEWLGETEPEPIPLPEQTNTEKT